MVKVLCIALLFLVVSCDKDKALFPEEFSGYSSVTNVVSSSQWNARSSSSGLTLNLSSSSISVLQFQNDSLKDWGMTFLKNRLPSFAIDTNAPDSTIYYVSDLSGDLLADIVFLASDTSGDEWLLILHGGSEDIFMVSDSNAYLFTNKSFSNRTGWRVDTNFSILLKNGIAIESGILLTSDDQDEMVFWNGIEYQGATEGGSDVKVPFMEFAGNNKKLNDKSVAFRTSGGEPGMSVVLGKNMQIGSIMYVDLGIDAVVKGVLTRKFDGGHPCGLGQWSFGVLTISEVDAAQLKASPLNTFVASSHVPNNESNNQNVMIEEYVSEENEMDEMFAIMDSLAITMIDEFVEQSYNWHDSGKYEIKYLHKKVVAESFTGVTSDPMITKYIIQDSLLLYSIINSWSYNDTLLSMNEVSFIISQGRVIDYKIGEDQTRDVAMPGLLGPASRGRYSPKHLFDVDRNGFPEVLQFDGGYEACGWSLGEFSTFTEYPTSYGVYWDGL